LETVANTAGLSSVFLFPIRELSSHGQPVPGEGAFGRLAETAGWDVIVCRDRQHVWGEDMERWDEAEPAARADLA
jgi:hypothetical protein